MSNNAELAVVLKLVADQFQSELRKSKGTLGDFTRELTNWKVGLAAVGTALFASTKATANEGEQLLLLSQKLNMTTEKLSGLQYAAKLSNVENETLTKGLKELAINVSEAAAGTGEGADLFKRLGINVKDTAGHIRPMGAIFDDVADKFGKMERGAVRTELAQKSFSKAGFEMMNMLDGGSAELARMHAEAEKLGTVWSTKDAIAANEFNDALDRLTSRLKGLRNEIGGNLLGSMKELADTFSLVASKDNGFGILDAVLLTVNVQLGMFNNFLREVLANYKAVRDFIKTDKTFEQVTAELKAAIDKSEAELNQKLFFLRNPNAPRDMFESASPGKNKPLTREQGALKEDKSKKSKGESALEAELKAMRESIRAELDEKKLSLEEQASMVDAAKERNEISSAEELAYKRQLLAAGRDAERDAFSKELDALKQYYMRRKKLGFESKEEEQKFSADYARQISEAVRKEETAETHARIKDRQDTVAAEKLIGQEQEGIGRALVESFIAERQIMERTEEEKGRRIVEAAKSEFDIKKKLRDDETNEFIAYWQANLDGEKAMYASRETMALSRVEVLKGQLAKELGVTVDTVAKIVAAWKAGDDELAKTLIAGDGSAVSDMKRDGAREKFVPQIEQEERFQESPALEGLKQGMHQFVTDTGSMFNMGVEMARQTASSMKSSLESGFFDAMNGKILSLKDAWGGAFNFMQKTAANVLSTVTSNLLMSGLNSAMSSGGGGGGWMGAAMSLFSSTAGKERGGWIEPKYFAAGGAVYSNRDSVPAMLTPGEFVVSRTGVEALERMNKGIESKRSGGSPISVNMNIQTPNAESFQASKTQLLASLQVAMRHAQRNL